jgi:hypothetical protein
LVCMCPMYLEIVGMLSKPRRSCRNCVMRELMPSTRGLDHAVHSFGSKSRGRLCIMSVPRRCGSFWSVQLLKSLSRVCRSVISVASLLYCCFVSFSCSMKNSFANVADPTGVPSRRNPLVSSMPIVLLCFFSME